MRAKLNQCKKCGKTYNLNEVSTTEKYCCSCNEKRLNELRKKDVIRKKDNRNDKVSSELEKLAGIEE